MGTRQRRGLEKKRVGKGEETGSVVLVETMRVMRGASGHALCRVSCDGQAGSAESTLLQPHWAPKMRCLYTLLGFGSLTIR